MKSDLSKVKVGDKIWTIQDGWTEVERVRVGYDYPIITDSASGHSYTLDGKGHSDDKYPLAFLECPFKDLPIEKDTLVWFRDYEYSHWNIGYYSHFKDGKHFVFDGSKKSTETDVTYIFNIVTTENPLSC